MSRYFIAKLFFLLSVFVGRTRLSG